MNPKLFPIPGPWPGELAISARPRGGDWLEGDVRGWLESGVTTVLSLLEPSEENDLELHNERATAQRCRLHFCAFPVADRSVPLSAEKTAWLILDLKKALDRGQSLAIHCRQSIGRSSMIAAGILIAAGIEPKAAFDQVSAARGVPVPDTPEQRLWVEHTLTESLQLARQ